MQNSKAFSPAALRQFALYRALPPLLGVAAAFIARWQLELSNDTPADFLAGQWPLYAPLNALTAFCLTLVLYALFQKWSRATWAAGAVFTAVAVINYYTRELHGSALMPQDVLNLGTAAEVMGSYTLHISRTVVLIVLAYLPVFALARVQRRLERRAPARRLRGAAGYAVRALAGAACCTAILYLGYFSPWPVKPSATYGWAWQNTYYTYGYLAGTVESSMLLRDPIIQPAGYTDAAAAGAATAAEGYARTAPAVAEQDYPDIILILSESFYDLSLVTDPQTDLPVFPVTQNLTNAITGHTVSPHVGGGTNASEYEMLTGNSLMLMPSITPFNWLNLNRANSLVNYLDQLGYTSMAAHPYTNSNYRRDTAWRALGFDTTHFIADFPTKEYYGNRPYQTDSATYRDFTALYEQMPADAPRFAFLVSIQSHGDYEMNPPELDRIHAATDYGAYDSVVDEYLSCMSLSDAAVGELTDYFTALYQKTGRRVIVAMAGDHAPSFIDHIADQSIPENERQLLERSTPYLIWANYPLANAGATNPADPYNRMDLCDLAPTLVEQAGLPLSAYYTRILQMKQTLPVQTAANDYMLPDGTTAEIGQNPACDTLLRDYFYLEYNNIGTAATRADALYLPGAQ